MRVVGGSSVFKLPSVYTAIGVVGDGGRVGVDSGVSLVTDEVVVCVRRKCIGSCL